MTETALSARDRILLTAHDLFYRDGIRATGVDRLIAALDSLPDDDANAEDTRKIQAVLADSKTPAAVRAAVGFLAPFPKESRIKAAIILGLFVLALVAIGGAKWLGLV